MHAKDTFAPTEAGPFRIEVDSMPSAEWDQSVSNFDAGHYEQAASANNGRIASCLVLRGKDAVIEGGTSASSGLAADIIYRVRNVRGLFGRWFG